MDKLFSEKEVAEWLESIGIPQNVGQQPECEVIYKCECGSEKCGSPRHSDWCPKHED